MSGLAFRDEAFATLAEVEALCRRLREALLALPDPADRFALELLCRESLANSARHSCHLDARKRVRIDLASDGKEAVCRISDDGDGFPGRVAEPEEPSPLSENGRGLIIMGKYSEGISFEDEGRTIVLRKRLAGREPLMNENPVYSPGRDIVAAMADAIKSEVKALIASSSGTFTFDLKGVEMIDSKGIGLLIATFNSLSQAGRGMRIIGATSDIAELLMLMRLDRHFAIE